MRDRDDGSPHDGSSGADDHLSADETVAPSPGSPISRPTSSGQLLGTLLDHFEILERIGAGGFGEVYRARDTHLGRVVAVKVLPDTLAGDAERRERFRREAVAASALNHPNICTVHQLVEAGGRFLIVMELVEGKTLFAALKEGPFPLEKLLPVALQITEALGEAHRAGILHRDIKPGNIAITAKGNVKVLDFGLAKLIGTVKEGTEGSTLDRLTEEGSIFGTLSYMSPEQLLSKQLDKRSDLFSLGIVLYEMATGRLPFEGTSKIATADAILHAEPRTFTDRPVPSNLKPIVQRLLKKDPEKRYAIAEDLQRDLASLQESLAPRKNVVLSRGAWIGVAAVFVVLAGLAGWYWRKSSRERWALAQIPEIKRLVDASENGKAAALLRQMRAVLPQEPALEKLWMEATIEVSVESVPPGADVSIRPYRGDENAWESLGRTPFEKIRVPQNFYVWRLAKAGFVTQQRFRDTLKLSVRLDPEGSIPPGMARVAGGDIELQIPGLDHFPAVPLDDYLIDQHEVMNEEYRKFIEAGGYEKREYWKDAFVRDGLTIPWEQAINSFRDTTGRPGPATWEVGSFPKGQERHPVAGVSWYEAAAYAEFAGKSLPTAYHWSRAAQPWFGMLIAPGSNFRGAGTQAVGGPGTLSGFGTTDMAGNVKEWCRNEGGEGKRFILGGGFSEPAYMFLERDAQSPWDRRPNYGLRCVKLPAPPPAAAAAKLEAVFRDYSKEKPVSDEVYKAFKRLYAYDKGALNARIEETRAAGDWTREKVSFDAAYGAERVTAYLYLPKSAAPPFQTVVYFPGSEAIFEDRFEDGDSFIWPFVPKSGRALMFPIYKSTYERRDGLKSDSQQPTAYWRDHMVAWSKDFGRSVDYLETRADVDSTKMAFLGFSWGAVVGPIMLTVDGRLKAGILAAGGLEFTPALPEADPFNFLSRVRTPVLVLNGRYDHFLPVESSQLPFFRLLGTPDGDKRHVIYDSGHVMPPKDFIRESLDWLDKYLGPVKR